MVAGAGYSSATRLHLHDVYVIGWKSDLKPSCATIATVDESYPEAATETVQVPGGDSVPFVAGYAVADTNARSGHGTENGTTVDMFNQRGQPTPLAFDVAVIC